MIGCGMSMGYGNASINLINWRAVVACEKKMRKSYLNSSCCPIFISLFFFFFAFACHCALFVKLLLIYHCNMWHLTCIAEPIHVSAINGMAHRVCTV